MDITKKKFFKIHNTIRSKCIDNSFKKAGGKAWLVGRGVEEKNEIKWVKRECPNKCKIDETKNKIRTNGCKTMGRPVFSQL